MDIIGAHKNVEYCLNLIDFNGASPVLWWRGSFWYIHTHDRSFGTLVVTKFSDPTTPLYAIRTPYSRGKMLGEIIMSGDNLHAHEDPYLIEIPLDLIPVT